MSNDQVPEDKRTLYQQLVDTHPEIELLGGKKLPYTSMNGNMYSQMSKDGRLGLRLGKVDFEAFIKEHNTQPFKNYGVTMKEYVEVPDSLLQHPEALAPYLAKSHEYAKTLKPKATKKKK